MLEQIQVLDILAHVKDPSAHHRADFQTAGGGGGTHTVQVDVDQPDLLGTALVRMIHAHADWAPNGLEVVTVKIDTTESSTYSVTFQIRSTPTGSGTTIATVATSASEEAETSILTNSVVGPGDYIYAVLPATDVAKLGLEVNFNII